MYDANCVAKYILNYGMENAAPVTNLKLQKLLYFLWIAFYKVKGEALFDNTIYAWPLGPVVSDVYDEYCAYGGLEIRKTFDDIHIDEEDMEILTKALIQYMPYSAQELVNMSHIEGKPWDQIFAKGTGRGRRIPFELIIKDECN